MSVVRRGVVRGFHDARGTGEIESNGVVYPFHCTQIADGTRTIAPGTEVVFVVVPGHHGRWEAARIGPVGAAAAAMAPEEAAVDEGSFACPVCGTMVTGTARAYEICGVCGWEDDPVQFDDPTYAGGANAMSLHDAKRARR